HDCQRSSFSRRSVSLRRALCGGDTFGCHFRLDLSSDSGTRSSFQRGGHSRMTDRVAPVLPEQFIILRENLPPADLAHAAIERLRSVAPALGPSLSRVDLRFFGVESGFFYLPLAQAREWGMEEDRVRELGTALALGHIHYALQDQLLDDGHLSPEQTLLSEAVLWSYLDLFSHAARIETSVLVSLHLSCVAPYVDALM